MAFDILRMRLAMNRRQQSYLLQNAQIQLMHSTPSSGNAIMSTGTERQAKAEQETPTGEPTATPIHLHICVTCGTNPPCWTEGLQQGSSTCAWSS
jgi:hypothetical protein